MEKYRDLGERLLANSIAVDCGHRDAHGMVCDCWLWIGNTDAKGYARLSMRVDGRHKTLRAARVSFAWFTGHDLASIETVDHLCRQRECIAPLHLEPVTRVENSVRSQRDNPRTPTARRTVCAPSSPPATGSAPTNADAVESTDAAHVS